MTGVRGVGTRRRAEGVGRERIGETVGLLSITLVGISVVLLLLLVIVIIGEGMGGSTGLTVVDDARELVG
jgi:hypothetical protein